MTDLNRARLFAIDNYQSSFLWDDTHCEDLARDCITRDIAWYTNHVCPGCSDCTPLIESAVQEVMAPRVIVAE